ncbi:Glycolate dehydrogenase, subunit GlcD [Thermodesulfovibrio sp. N1]|uniref:FAD-binding oxidoreductase n=1 Tax=Thermodesulfovibrio sp. N1 TaxID=1871110 RepID=UPI00083A8312|nr:FAD-linked oxidase C-terminal domain-containing protein [Thermodesulfovibrio sp. N1]ODA44201.1 Glycolate dehydrogenase, subunit GlcD [Thermodesulfovibrio sp. N1]
MKDLTLINGIEISDEKEDLICYSYDASYSKGSLPELIAWPKNTEEIVRIVKWATNKGLKIVPRGAGTGMAGGAIPINSRSIIVSLEKMREILEVNTKNFTTTLQPGVINGELQKELTIYELFYPPDPASLDYCTIGGNVATNAGGPRAIKYGVTRNYVLELETVLSTGGVFTLGGKTFKRVTGYEIKELFIGSEGTLGIISKVTLRVLPQPEEVITLLVSFDSIESAGDAVPKIIGSGIIPRTLEFLDSSCLQLVETNYELGLPSASEAMLLVELDGEVNSLKRQGEKIVDIVRKYKGETQVATDYYSRENLWKARRSISPCILKMKDKEKINIDIAVPIDNLSTILKKLNKLSIESKIPIICFGHAGDGNIHVNILINKGNEEEKKQGFEIVKKIFEFTVSIGGVISGEHGIGITKKPYIDIQLDRKHIELMQAIKRVFDPKGIMNPGKIF